MISKTFKTTWFRRLRLRLKKVKNQIVTGIAHLQKCTNTRILGHRWSTITQGTLARFTNKSITFSLFKTSRIWIVITTSLNISRKNGQKVAWRLNCLNKLRRKANQANLCYLLNATTVSILQKWAGPLIDKLTDPFQLQSVPAAALEVMEK